MGLSAQDLLQQAEQKTGLSDFGDDWFMGSLEAYVSDLSNQHLSEWGAAFLTRLPVKDLVRRLQIIDCLKRNPQIEETPIPPILYVTGHERSGTTMLHNLLSQHEAARFLSRWELMAPTPPPEAASFHKDPRRLQVQKSIDALRGTDLESMHWVEAHEPEECVWGFMDCTGLLGMAPSLIMPNWNRWLNEEDLSPTFVNYRKLIQLLTWKNPVPEGGFLVLKAPLMGNYLHHFSRVFPEAKFLYIHRDPYRVLKSFCTLMEVVNGPFLKDVGSIGERERDEQFILKRMGKYYRSLERFEADHPDKVWNVQYIDLVESPSATIASVFQRMGVTEDVALASNIEEFLSRQKAGRAKPRQQFTSFGYTCDDVRKDPQIAHYLQRYQVLLEASRQTGM